MSPPTAPTEPRRLGDRGALGEDLTPLSAYYRRTARRLWQNISTRQRRRDELAFVDLGGEG
jgi:hypothetical protein